MDKFNTMTRDEIAGVASYLYQLLDDIDTADDAARDNDAQYRTRVRKIQARKAAVVVSCDGYTVEFKPAAKEGGR